MTKRYVTILVVLLGFACSQSGPKPQKADARPASQIQTDLKSLEALRSQKVDPGMLKLREDDPVSEVLGDQVDELEKDRQQALDRCREILNDELKDPAAFAKVPVKVTKRDECLMNFVTSAAPDMPAVAAPATPAAQAPSAPSAPR